MNITPEFVQKVARVAKSYKSAEVKDRAVLGRELDAAVADLTEKQCAQLAKLVNRCL